MKLNQIAAGQNLSGVEHDQIVTVVAVIPQGDSALQLIYRTPDGSIKERCSAPAMKIALRSQC
ncbi:hypothetical protein NIES2135_61140 (plasmid) [Leptolyngbya boryana NIES-2135]|jgi:hypothetical protein|uniref:Uncharacterized protein n=2 Tax=Leptolyngbya group TaxID=3081713 RepID=A0A1Z4JRE3_LEPBY|nr:MULTISPECIES: hypothetical protein [Leptolyngbya]BAY59237.1 hypothetical protein NIES2135_61140 [Leptolyngbya boryana NIES-2135]